MQGWDWLEHPEKPYTWGFFLRVVLKAVVLFALFNAAFYAADPLPQLGEISIYNGLVPGRERFSYAEDPAAAYNVTTANLDALFSSHVIGTEKAPREYRVLVLGDSSVWGDALMPQETTSSALNANLYRLDDQRHMRFYNLGYLHSSVTRDVLLLDRGLDYEPDMVVWFITLYGVEEVHQQHYLLENNAAAVTDLYQRYPIPPLVMQFAPQNRTFFDQRGAVNTLLQLQVYGLPWAITGIDQAIPERYPVPTHSPNDFDDFQGIYTPQELEAATVTGFDLMAETINRYSATIPFVVVNEPMFVAHGANSDKNYNNYYPRWAFDTYRELLHSRAETQDWPLLDLWDAIPPEQFSTTELHLTAQGARMLAVELGPELVAVANGRE